MEVHAVKHTHTHILSLSLTHTHTHTHTNTPSNTQVVFFGFVGANLIYMLSSGGFTCRVT